MFRYDRLDDLIESSGKKKKYLSERMGHAGRYLNDAKKQNTNIKGDDLRILAEELNTTPEYLTGESDEKEKPAHDSVDELEEEFLRLIRQCSPEQKQREILYLREILGAQDK